MACWLLIAGVADSLEYAKCERIGDIMQLSLPSAKIETRAVLPKEWDRFFDDVCEKHNFNRANLKGRQCIVWNRSGKLVGHAQAFEKFAATRYQIECDLTAEQLQKNAKANAQIALQARRQLQLRLKHDTRRALVVVDMQVDFSSSGRLGTGAVMDDVIPIVNCVLQNHSWSSVAFLQLQRQYSDFEQALRHEAVVQREKQLQQHRERLQGDVVNITQEQPAGGGGHESRPRPRRRRKSTVSAAVAAAAAAAAAAASPTQSSSALPSVGGLDLLKFHPHCIEGEMGSNVHPYLKAGNTASITLGHRHPLDFGPLLQRMLEPWKNAGVKEVFLCGVSLEGSNGV